MAQSYKTLCDSAARLIHTGDLVLRLGNDFTSYSLAQFNQSDKTYSHCGIASVDSAGAVFIYHAIGGEYNPDQKIKKEPAEKWFSSEHNFALGVARFDLDSNQIRKLMATIWQYYDEGRKFDLEFDMSTDDRLYCAEMIYKAVTAAAGDSSYLPVTHALGRRFAGVDNLFINSHTHMICQLRYK
ncbi:MAG TPA: hypothetical protein VL098_13620 [Flavipsychrobacter sp.]|nr:hypothetical protein [Flavipsychrobacter sp.]